MKARVQIPKGWRKIPIRSRVFEGRDFHLDRNDMEWKPCQWDGISASTYFIRRKVKKARSR